MDYDQEVAPGDIAMIRLRDGDKLETQTVQTIADVSASLDTDYFTLEGASGTWAVWYDVDDDGATEPAHGATNSIEITGVATDDTAATVASVTATELAASAEFSADFDVSYDATADDDLITITDKFNGTRTNIAAGTSGFTVATTQGGAAGRSLYAKASAGSMECLVAVMPN